MPNHVHVLITLLHECALTKIVKSWKSYTALQINRAFGRSGRLWMPDYYDRYIRDGRHYEAVVHYIENNAVKAGLVAAPTDWEFSSARRSSHNR